MAALLRLLLVLGLCTVSVSAFGLCDVLNVIGTWKSPCDICTYDFTGDGNVDLNDILYVISRWDGSPSCDATAAPSVVEWTVESSSSASTLCDVDVTIDIVIRFSGNTAAPPVTNFTLQADAPVQAALVVPNSVSLTSEGAAQWGTSNCNILNVGAYSYFSCQGGGSIRGGDVFRISYQLRNLDTQVGIYQSEITTFPPVALASPVVLDMTCGKTTTTTTQAMTTTPASFAWVTTLSGPSTFCGSAQYTVSVNVLSGASNFQVGSSFIRDEDVRFLNPESSISGITCALFSDKTFACDGLADRPFDITFTIQANSDDIATISVKTGLLGTNEFDKFNTKAISYTAACK